MDWKIMAASFAALVIVSSVLLGGFGLGDFFSDIINTIGGLLGSSPFGGATSASSGLAASIVFFPSEFSLETDHPLNISTASVNLEMFDGEIYVDYSNELISFRPESTELSIDLTLQEIVIDDIELSKISVEDMSFEIFNEESGKTSGEGNVEISDFSGRFTIGMNRIEFDGNVSSISVKTGDSVWELK